jgi:CelD/BcsL family acetyltransferase involved in cellulose biosynthesis
MSLSLVLHQEIPEDERLHREWNALVLGMEQPEVFYTYEWGSAVQAAYRDTVRPLVFLAYRNNSLAGVVLLCTSPTASEITFLTANTADYCDFISPAAERAEFVELVFAELVKRGASKIVLTNLPADSETSKAISAAAQKLGLFVFQRPAYLCAQVMIGVAEDREKLKASVAGKKMLQRKLRSLDQAGAIGYLHLDSWNLIQPALEHFFSAHTARFQATGRTSSLATRERRAFLEDLARRFSNSGVVVLSILTINDRPVAWNYGFKFEDSWFWYQPTFDGRWEQHSPGYCLLAKIVMDACEDDKIKIVDLGLGDEGYKERFRNADRQTLHITATNSRPRHWMGVMRYRAAGKLKQYPKVERAIRSLLRRG